MRAHTAHYIFLALEDTKLEPTGWSSNTGERGPPWIGRLNKPGSNNGPGAPPLTTG